jgi:hypothetical protein
VPQRAQVNWPRCMLPGGGARARAAAEQVMLAQLDPAAAVEALGAGGEGAGWGLPIADEANPTAAGACSSSQLWTDMWIQVVCQGALASRVLDAVDMCAPPLRVLRWRGLGATASFRISVFAGPFSIMHCCREMQEIVF